jgi:protein translocase SecG subunit
MASFIIILIVIVAVLLGVVVLIQNPKGGGLAVGFQGTAQVGGVQRTTDFLEKATWYLAIGLFVLCLISAHWYTTKKLDTNPDSGTQTQQTSGGDTNNGDGSNEQTTPAP